MDFNSLFSAASKIGAGAGAGGAASGLLAAAGPIGMAASLAPTAFKFFSGLSQKRQANRMNIIDPGYQMNSEVIDNARIMGDRYGNYQMPGYAKAQNDLQTNATTAFNTGVQGASSGGDVLDLASKINYGTGQNLNDLANTNAQSKEQALQAYLTAKGMAGNEKVKKNQYELDNYQRKLAEKAALTQAGNMNAFSAGDDAANAIRSFTQPQQDIVQPGASGIIIKGGKIFKEQ